MKTEMVFETSVSTKAEPHYPAENPKELLHESRLTNAMDGRKAVRTGHAIYFGDPNIPRMAIRIFRMLMHVTCTAVTFQIQV
jgi:hypothetical protein